MNLGLYRILIWPDIRLTGIPDIWVNSKYRNFFLIKKIFLVFNKTYQHFWSLLHSLFVHIDKVLKKVFFLPDIFISGKGNRISGQPNIRYNPRSWTMSSGRWWISERKMADYDVKVEEWTVGGAPAAQTNQLWSAWFSCYQLSNSRLFSNKYFLCDGRIIMIVWNHNKRKLTRIAYASPKAKPRRPWVFITPKTRRPTAHVHSHPPSRSIPYELVNLLYLADK